MTTNMFEKASRLGIRYETDKGLITVEDLWRLPLQSKTGKTNLDSIAISLNKEIKDSDNGLSFVNTTTSPDAIAQLKFDIVLYIIGVRKAEEETKAQALANAAKKQQILELIAAKQNEELSNRSLDDLIALANQL